MLSDDIRILPVLDDNCCYLLPWAPDRALVVDPGAAGPPLAAAAEGGWTITHVLVTHGHDDHTSGLRTLARTHPCERIDADRTLGGLDIRVLTTPGHTADSRCFSLTAGPGEVALFTGDTLFCGGCGRTRDPARLWASLQGLLELDNDMLVYPGHDYTAENYAFALEILPDDVPLRLRRDQAQAANAAGLPALPSTLGEERAVNIFCRAGQSTVAAAVGLAGAPPVDVFTELRRRKNAFG